MSGKMATSPLLTPLDGSLMEGGGQILRLSVALSAILKKPICIEKIRAGRDQPGLKSQHMTGIRLVREICNGQVTGCDIGSSQLRFNPKDGICFTGGHLTADCGTAGGITLLAQVSLPCLLFNEEPVDLELKGGTDARFASTIDYFQQVLQPNLARFGVNFQSQLVRRGYFPKGGGCVGLKVQPLADGESVQPIDLTDPGQVTKVRIYSHVAGRAPLRAAQKMAEAARREMAAQFPNAEIAVETEAVPEAKACWTGSGIMITAATSTGCVMGEGCPGAGGGKKGGRGGGGGVDSGDEEVGRKAARALIESCLKRGACVDSYMQDQLIIFMALAKGSSSMLAGPLTLHTKTAIHFAQIMAPEAKFELEEKPDGNVLIRCTGIGHKRSCRS